jgi:hypothetical protein
MKQDKSQLQDLARRLVHCENGEMKSAATTLLIAAPVCEKLRPHLAMLMGRMGFRALLAHALARAVKDAPLLQAVHVTSAGTLEDSDHSTAAAETVNPVEDSVALLARLIELLMDFIGENLTLRMLCEVWPTLLLSERDFNNGDSE